MSVSSDLGLKNTGHQRNKNALPPSQAAAQHFLQILPAQLPSARTQVAGGTSVLHSLAAFRFYEMPGSWPLAVAPALGPVYF